MTRAAIRAKKPAPANSFPTMRLKHVAQIQVSNVDKALGDGEQQVRLCNYVDAYYNERLDETVQYASGSATGQEIHKFSLRADDVVITKDSESPNDIAVPALVKAGADGVVCGYHLAVLRPKPALVSGDFLFWSLKSQPIREAFSIRAQGITRFGLTLNGIGTVPVPIPRLSVQHQISDFLNRETSRVDRLLALKANLLELLSEKEASLIARAVTRGLDPDVPSASTGLQWLPEAPRHWKVFRLATLLREVAEAGDPALPVLSVSIHNGISDRELDDEERDRKVSQIEDKTVYKRVRPGYLAYNMMRAWQGAFGVATIDGLVSPAYVVARPSASVFPPYLEYLLRTPSCIEEMRRMSKGIASFRLRLYWDGFRQIRVALPPLDEQKRIAEFLAETVAKISKAKAAVSKSIERLREYRLAVVTAAIAGQIGCETSEVRSPADSRQVRSLVSAEIVDRHRATKKFGRVKLQKLLYLAEAHADIGELQGVYVREAAGPLDRSLMEEAEKGMDAYKFYRADSTANGNGAGVAYVPLANAGKHKTELSRHLGNRIKEMTRIIDLLREFDTRVVEAITTLYAVWNDMLIDARAVSDDAIIAGFLNDWHPEKADKFRDADLHYWLDWMRRNDVVPKGKGPKTVTGRLFP